MIDTSTLVTAIRSNTGAAKAVVDLALARKFTLLLNYPLVCEYREVLLRPQHVTASGLSPKEINHLIDNLQDIAEPVEIFYRYRPLSPDAKDDLILDLAINGNADLIVTNNLRHLQPPAASFNILVLDAHTALSTMTQ